VYVVAMSHGSVCFLVQPLSKYVYAVSLRTVCPFDGGADSVASRPAASYV
jgi:hypothetical protein